MQPSSQKSWLPGSQAQSWPSQLQRPSTHTQTSQPLSPIALLLVSSQTPPARAGADEGSLPLETLPPHRAKAKTSNSAGTSADRPTVLPPLTAKCDIVQRGFRERLSWSQPSCEVRTFDATSGSRSRG